MKLVIVSNAPFIFKDEKCYAYGPYVNELIIWGKYASQVSFCCPVWETQKGLLIGEITFAIKKHFKLVDFNLNGFVNIVKVFFSVLYNILIIYKAMAKADHIHLRCPGNIGLLGCLVQVLFPSKPKTAKYAGNWDPKSKQPWSYRLQKWILSNTFLTRNMQVLVYGNWENQSKNIKPFFTSTYSESEKEVFQKETFSSGVEIVFVGSLVSGKNPMYAVKLAESLIKHGYKIMLNIYGDGAEKQTLENYIHDNQLKNNVILHGNQNQKVVKKAYQKSHFVVLPSKSEGWPKAIAEGMFWGCVPIATKVSCVPFMLDYGNRGITLEMDLENDLIQIGNTINNESDFLGKSKLAREWSQQYTLDFFESEIKKMIES